jgi:integrase
MTLTPRSRAMLDASEQRGGGAGEPDDSAEPRAGGYAGGHGLTLRQYGEIFLAGYSKANSKSSERRHKEWALRHHVIPLLGERPLAALTKSDGELLKVQLESRGLGGKSINNVLAILKTMLRQAVDDELLMKNPWAHVKKKKLRRRGTWSYWTREEAETFLRHAQLAVPHMYPMFLTLLRTGMRIGEMAGLFWEDVDFERGEVHLRRQFSTERVWGTLKNDDERTVGLSPQLARALREHQKRTFLLDPIEVEIGRRIDRGHLVFVNRRSGPVTVDTLKKVRDEICTRSGVKRIRIHDMRHTVATILRRQGVSCEDIAELFGHADSQMTQRYAHIMPEVQLRTVHLLDDAADERAAVSMSSQRITGLLDETP